MGLFSIFAKPLGWVLRWIYSLVPSYFVALLIFTVATRLILFPLSIKNQKNQADRARLAPRLERIQKKYAQDRQKMAMKQQELYEKEGVKMTGGCLPMVFQMLVLFSVIAVIYKPLTYVQDVKSAEINACISVAVSHMDATNKTEKKQIDQMNNEKSYYRELYLLKHINDETRPEMELAVVNVNLSENDTLSKKIETATLAKVEAAKAAATAAGETFDEAKFKEENKAAIEAEVIDTFYKDNADLFIYARGVLDTIVKTGSEFSLGKISLLGVPQDYGIQPNWLWIIVLASGLSSFATSMLSMKYSKASMPKEQQQAAGCTNNMMMYMMPVMSLVFSFTVPAGVAVYWTVSNLLAMVQTVALNAMYSPAKARAQAEIEYAARRQKKREDKERLKAARLAEQAAWQEEENKAKARAKGDISQKKSAESKATPAELPHHTADTTDPVSEHKEEDTDNE